MIVNSLASKTNSSKKIEFKKGDLVKLNINKNVSPEGLVLCSTTGDKITLYEKIDLETFPSYKDFKGHTGLFESEIFLVIEKSGRPWSFKLGDDWSLYDAYTIYHGGKTYQCFAYCLEKAILNAG